MLKPDLIELLNGKAVSCLIKQGSSGFCQSEWKQAAYYFDVSYVYQEGAKMFCHIPK